YNIYVSMLDEEELDCLKYVQRLRKYTNRQLSVAASPNDTDESKPEKRKRGMNKKVAGDDVVASHRHPPNVGYSIKSMRVCQFISNLSLST
ncbi:MAG: hypothetical protein ACKPKO_30570, partial [Candidatus Fonsibacter sp.]